jgi:hypothetical protein
LNNTIFVVLLGTIGRGDEVDDAVVPEEGGHQTSSEAHQKLISANHPKWSRT